MSIDDQTGTYPGQAALSVDGGTSWAPIPGLAALGDVNLHSVRERGDLVVVWSETSVYQSTDAAASFVLITSSTFLHDLVVWPDDVPSRIVLAEPGGVRVGERGVWRQAILPEPLPVTRLAVASDGTIVAATATQRVWRSDDGGDTWIDIGAALPSQIEALDTHPDFASNPEIVASTPAGAFRVGVDGTVSRWMGLQRADDVTEDLTCDAGCAAADVEGAALGSLRPIPLGTTVSAWVRGRSVRMIGETHDVAEVQLSVDGVLVATVPLGVLPPGSTLAEATGLADALHHVSLKVTGGPAGRRHRRGGGVERRLPARRDRCGHRWRDGRRHGRPRDRRRGCARHPRLGYGRPGRPRGRAIARMPGRGMQRRTPAAAPPTPSPSVRARSWTSDAAVQGNVTHRDALRTVGAPPFGVWDPMASRLSKTVSKRWVWLAALVPTITEWLESGHLPSARREWISDGVLTILMLGFATLVTAQVRALETTTFTDPLTGLLNRRSFDRDLHNAVIRVRQRGGRLVLAVIDVDHFKAINDGWGHAIGDQVLREVAQVLQSHVRAPMDTCYRVGGDEFAVLFSAAEGLDVGALFGRLQRAAQQGPTGPPCVPTSLSIGLVTWQPDESAEAFLCRGDKTMYSAKSMGRGRVHIDAP
jgi:diguanylate cyclase (GGDEF)-like protein